MSRAARGQLAPRALEHLDGRVLLYVLASLTVVRMIPVALSLLGARLRWDTVLVLGWFGPRGIATFLFALVMLEQSELMGSEVIMAVAMTAVLLSVFAHGVSAYPLAKSYAGRAKP